MASPGPRFTTEREDIILEGLAAGRYLENSELIDRLQIGLAWRDWNSA